MPGTVVGCLRENHTIMSSTVMDKPASAGVLSLADDIDRPDRETLLAAVREIARGPVTAQAESVDRGFYPEEVLRQLGEVGAFRAHLAGLPGGPDYVTAIEALAEVSKACASTGFVYWCQLAATLFAERTPNAEVFHDTLLELATGEALGGTGISNAMKSIGGLEENSLKARPDGDGFIVDGLLPWVSNLGPDHYFGAMAVVDTPQGPKEVMFLANGEDPGVSFSRCPTFSGLEGTATLSVSFRGYRVPARNVLAYPARPFVGHICSAFVLLQCGVGWGIIQGAIDSIREVAGQQNGVNDFLDDQPDALQAELDAIVARVASLAGELFQGRKDLFIDVLTVRAEAAVLALRATQAALLHQGARGYLMNSPVQRRVREAQFVAIVTPAIKHIRKEIERQKALLAAA